MIVVKTSKAYVISVMIVTIFLHLYSFTYANLVLNHSYMKDYFQL